jgi:predicted porin
MKKSLIALAALAATGAFAQSTVTLSGTMDPSIYNEKRTYGNGYEVSQTYMNNSRQGTTGLTFAGVEDLGGGLRAVFNYTAEFNASAKSDGPNPTTSNTTGLNFLGSGGGQVFTGLRGNYGNLLLGAANNPSLGVQAGRQPFSTKTGGGFGTTMGTSRVRDNNSIQYSSPVLFGGLTVAVSRAFGVAPDAQAASGTTLYSSATPTTEVAGRNDASITWAAGAVRTGISRYVVDPTATTVSNTQTNLFTQFDLGAHTLFIGAHNETSAAQVQTSSYNVGARVNVMPNANILFNYGALKDLTTANTPADRTILGLGVKYDLSKRSSVYARYVAEKNDNVTATTSAKEITTMLMGMQHNF